MSRIGTYGASQLYLSRLMQTQTRLNDLQLQVATEKKSPNYTGIATNASRLVNFETEISQATQFTQNNNTAATRMSAAQTSMSAVQSTMKNFRTLLDNFMQGDTTNPDSIKALQEQAIQAMTEMSSYLNVNVDGQYLFSGGRVSTAPVTLKTSSLADFQSIYDGYTTTFPTTRAANLQDLALTNEQTGSVRFDAANGAIIPDNAGAFANVATGSLVTIGGTTNNNGDVTITGHAATNVAGTPLTETTNAGANTFVTFPGGTLTNATTGALSFAFNPAGDMTVTPANANTLSGLTVGTKFTVAGSTGANYNGAYVVTGNANGVITIANDTAMAQPETVSVSSLSLKTDTAVVDGIPDTVAALGAISGDAKFQISGNTVTLTVPPGGTALSSLFAVGAPVTIDGTSAHDGTFKVTGATATTLSFDINPDALRTSLFVPQTGRADMTITYPSQTNQLTPDDYTSLSFSPTGTGGETITSVPANLFTDANGTNPKAGDVITLSSGSGVNDGAYKVVSNDGTNLVVESTTLTNETSATSSFSSTSWYNGDDATLTQRIDSNASVQVDLSAADPAFEKAFRAMGLIAQGVTGTAGGLDNNQDRVAAARYLIYDAMDGSAVGSPPYDTEERSNIMSLETRIGVVQSTISQRNDKIKQMISLFQARADDIENADKTQAIVELLDQQNSLEASYQTLTTVRGLSLLNYLK